MGVMAQMFCDAGDSGTQFTSATPPHPGLDGGGVCSIRSLPSACRRRVAPLMVQFPPFDGDVTGRQVTHGSPYSASPHSLLSVRPRLGAAWRPSRKPPRRQTPTTGCRGQGGLRCGRNGAWPGVSLAHEPLTMRVNPVTRTPTPRDAPGRRCRAYHRTHARSVEPTRIPSDPRARRGAQAARALAAVSHAIRLSELSTVSANVAIPTI